MKKAEKTDTYSHVLKYTGIFGGVQGLNILVGIIRNKFVAMILGPDGMGLVSLFNSTIKLVSDSTNLGLAMSAVREIADAYEKNETERIVHIVKLIRSWCLLTALMGMFLCIVLSLLLNRWTFVWGDHTLHFVLLSPIVALTAVTGGEMAILKGTRQLRHLAVISVYNIIGALLTSVPLYYIWKEAAIIPSLLIMALVQMVLTISYSYKKYPLRIMRERRFLGEGLGMVKLGIAFVIAGILGSGAEFIIRSYLNTSGNLGIVGLYNAGYMMTMTYAGMVFSAMETDFFPRLSAANRDVITQNTIVNRQIEVSFLLIAPLMVFFMIGLPVLLPLLYSGKFTPVQGMMQITIFAMYIRSLTLPVAYIPLARGDSKSYLFLEAVYDISLVLFIILGYDNFGLTGTGVAITMAGLFYFIIINVYARRKYKYKISSNVIRYILLQLPIGIIAYCVTFIGIDWLYWSIGLILFLISTALSLHILRSKTHLWASILDKIRRKFKR